MKAIIIISLHPLLVSGQAASPVEAWILEEARKKEQDESPENIAILVVAGADGAWRGRGLKACLRTSQLKYCERANVVYPIILAKTRR